MHKHWYIEEGLVYGMLKTRFGQSGWIGTVAYSCYGDWIHFAAQMDLFPLDTVLFYEENNKVRVLVEKWMEKPFFCRRVTQVDLNSRTLRMPFDPISIFYAYDNVMRVVDQHGNLWDVRIDEENDLMVMENWENFRNQFLVEEKDQIEMYFHRDDMRCEIQISRWPRRVIWIV